MTSGKYHLEETVAKDSFVKSVHNQVTKELVSSIEKDRNKIWKSLKNLFYSSTFHFRTLIQPVDTNSIRFRHGGFVIGSKECNLWHFWFHSFLPISLTECFTRVYHDWIVIKFLVHSLVMSRQKIEIMLLSWCNIFPVNFEMAISIMFLLKMIKSNGVNQFMNYGSLWRTTSSQRQVLSVSLPSDMGRASTPINNLNVVPLSGPRNEPNTSPLHDVINSILKVLLNFSSRMAEFIRNFSFWPQEVCHFYMDLSQSQISVRELESISLRKLK